MISRRNLLQMAATAPLFAHAGLRAQTARRVGGARILVQDGRVWMQVRFGRRGPYAFVIDTGAWANMIRRSVARELGLREVGQVLGVGLGGSQQFTHYEGREVALGNIGIGTADFAAYRDDFGDGIHRQAAGLLAANVLTTADSDLDFELGEWRIYPDGRGDRPGYEALPSSIRRSARQLGSARIFVDAVLDGRTYRLLADTGAPPQVILYSGAARRSGLWNETTPFSPHRLSGIGGAGARTRIVRGNALSVGGIRFDRPLVTLSDPDSRDTESHDGLLGIGLLELMNLSTDIRGGRLWAKRNARPPRPERYGLTGMWVDQRGDRLEISSLSPASPAAEAGLQVGDEIRGLTLETLVRRLAGRPGDVVEIAYRRGEVAATARVTLREYL